MKNFTLSVAKGIRQNPKNKIYSTQAAITTLEELAQAVQFDNTAGIFQHNHRKDENFISADCLFMDCDNDHSDKQEDWLTPEKLAEYLPDVEMYFVYSRHHMKAKDSKSGRPRFHVYFALSEPVGKSTRIREMKEKLLLLVPEFDKGAKDAARFFYGVENPVVSLQEGSMCIDEYLTIVDADLPDKSIEVSSKTVAVDTETSDDIISVGERHSTLVKTAIEALSKHSETKAREIFDKACARCKPQKSIEEVARIWSWALQKVKSFKDSVRERQKKVLNLRAVEQTLQQLNISVRFNVITKELEVGDLPEDAHIPEAYYRMTGRAKRKLATKMLPSLLISHLKEQRYGVSESFINDAISIIADANPLNPVLEMINATTWDGHDRLNDLYRVLGIQHSIQRSFLCKWLHQAISLALNDDADLNADFVLVLQGRQGLGKTNFFRKLAMAPEWFQDGAVIDMRNKDTIMQATSKWITELGELDATLKKEQTSLKAFITANYDTYRKPYAKKAEDVERRTCFCATVNPTEVIRDDTGSRRYILLHVDNMDKNFIYNVMTPEWCSQLWRQVYETFYLLKGRKGYFLTEEERSFIEKSNKDFTVMVDAESELLDCLDWSSDIDTWSWTKLMALEARCTPLKEKHFNARKIGRALTKILGTIAASRNTTVDEYKRSVNGYVEYWLPKNAFLN